jgi:hypothetical protein
MSTPPLCIPLLGILLVLQQLREGFYFLLVEGHEREGASR